MLIKEIFLVLECIFESIHVRPLINFENLRQGFGGREDCETSEDEGGEDVDVLRRPDLR